MNDENYLEKKFYREKRVREVSKKIKLLGVGSKLKTYTFLNIQIIGTVLVFVIGLFIKPIGFIIGPVLAFAYFLFSFSSIPFIFLSWSWPFLGHSKWNMDTG